jgi:hypothetical protein
MSKRIFFLAAAGLALFALLMSCTIPGMSDVEFAKELMAESADATGLYEASGAGKSGGSTADTLTITIDLPTGNPPDTGPYMVTFTFNDYTPGFAPSSLVNGELTPEVSLDLENKLVTFSFDDNDVLIVTGENAGTYTFDVTLIIDLSTGQYTYSGEIVIDNKVYKTG